MPPLAYNTDDTICAIASPPGGAARGIVRISGPEVVGCLADSFEADGARDWPMARIAAVFPGRLRLPGMAQPLSSDLYYWPGTRSYTRQPVAELHLPGSPPLVAAALRTVCQGGARPAEPGEFTLRAFLAGRLDLPQAEAVLGVIDAGGSRQLNAALTQLAGGISQPMTRVRQELLELLAHLEAGLDFVEEDIEFITGDDLQQRLAAAEDAVARLGRQLSQRNDAPDRVRIVLYGSPNVGKSSLFNALTEAEGAIVSAQPGTTRDYLVAPLVLSGIDCELIDTAGTEVLGGHDGTAEAASCADAAQRMTERSGRQADIRLFCCDATRPLGAWERGQLKEFVGSRAAASGFVLVLTKCDRPKVVDLAYPAIETSSMTSAGLDRLRQRLGVLAAECRHGGEQGVAATAVRCGESLRRAAAHLGEARRLSQTCAGEELVAVTIRAALDELGKVVGAVYTDDILDLIFSRFCIGK